MEETLNPPPEINYGSIPEAITAWEQDRHGEAVFKFLESAYGINNTPKVLAEAGMNEYLKYKEAGYFIGLVASQILKPNFYFLSNAVILNRLSRQRIPAALMVFEYPEDKFITRNHDKKDSFGWQKFYLGEKLSVKINLRPDRLQNQPVPLGSIDAASGHPCDQILVRAEQAQGPANMAYPNPAYALGIDIPQGLALTDYYRILWQQAISRLNLQVPVFHVNMVRLYSAIAQHSPTFNNQARMLSSGEYYPLQVAWPDLYLECSSHASPDFLNAISHAQQMRYAYGLPEVQVRLPHEQVPDLENLSLHPTGRFVDYNLHPGWKNLEKQIRSLASQMSDDDKNRKAELAKKINDLKKLQAQLIITGDGCIREVPFSLPPAVEQVYNNLLSGVTYAL